MELLWGEIITPGRATATVEQDEPGHGGSLSSRTEPGSVSSACRYGLGPGQEKNHVRLSELGATNQLPREIWGVFEKTEYGYLAVETNIGVVHVCHAPDADIEAFRDKPIRIIKMPTAPLIRLQLDVMDQSEDPYRFESYLNVAADDQAQVLAELANQKELHLAFYGDDLTYRFSKAIPHSKQQWQQLDELVVIANDYWGSFSLEQRDFDRAKRAFTDPIRQTPRS